MKHPGPWTFAPQSDWEWSFEDANGEMVIGGEGKTEGIDDDVIALIEAAPVMLSLLREVFQDGWVGSGHTLDVNIGDLLWKLTGGKEGYPPTP